MAARFRLVKYYNLPRLGELHGLTWNHHSPAMTSGTDAPWAQVLEPLARRVAPLPPAIEALQGRCGATSLGWWPGVGHECPNSWMVYDGKIL